MRVRRNSLMTLGLIACFFIAAAVGGAQAPTGTLCATDGSSSAKVQEVEGAFLKVTTNGCPSHPHTNAVGNNPNSAYTRTYIRYFPLLPVFRTLTPINIKFHTQLGAIGMAVTGVPLFGPATGPTGGDAGNAEIDTFDDGCGHAAGSGDYHYHIIPHTVESAGGDSNGHSALIGLMPDGFPLYGLFQSNGTRPSDLDVFGGHTDGIRGYHYHVDGPQGPCPKASNNYLGSLSPYGVNGFPYYGRALRGCVPDAHGTLQMEAYATCLASASAAPAGLYGASLSAWPNSTTTATPTTIATSSSASSTTSPSGPAGPNVLLIIADDLGAYEFDFLAPNETPDFAPTPNIHALKNRGVSFSNAYSEPICSSSRATVLTGLHPHKHGVGTTGGTAELSNAFQTLPKALAQSGLPISLGSFGKWHLGGDGSAPNSVGGWTNYQGVPENLDSYYNYAETWNGVVQQTSNVYETTQVTNNAISWVTLQRAAKQQFFGWVAYHAPHNPFQLPPANLHSSSGLANGTAPGGMQRAYYKAMVEAMDEEIGRLVASVNESDTTIIFVTDNGSPTQALPAFVPNRRGKGTLYEGGVHVPLIVAGPDIDANKTDTNLVHIVDIFNTVLELFNVSTISSLDSRSFHGRISNVAGSAAEASDSILAELFGPPAASTFLEHGRAVRKNDYKLIRTEARGFELFNVVSDPWEGVNLLLASPTTLETDGQYAILLNELATNYSAPDATFGFTTAAPVLPLPTTASTLATSIASTASTASASTMAPTTSSDASTASTLATSIASTASTASPSTMASTTSSDASTASTLATSIASTASTPSPSTMSSTTSSDASTASPSTMASTTSSDASTVASTADSSSAPGSTSSTSTPTTVSASTTLVSTMTSASVTNSFRLNYWNGTSCSSMLASSVIVEDQVCNPVPLFPGGPIDYSARAFASSFSVELRTWNRLGCQGEPSFVDTILKTNCTAFAGGYSVSVSDFVTTNSADSLKTLSWPIALLLIALFSLL